METQSISSNGSDASPRHALVLSGFSEPGSFGGGIYVLTDHGIEVVDERPTSGIYFDEANLRWLRALSARESLSIRTEVLEYRASADGSDALQLATVLDAHDVFSDGDRRLVVSSHHNAVMELRDGEARLICALPGEADSWHLNCLESVNGELFASAFHRGGSFRQWAIDAEGSGLVFSLSTGRIVADGLSMPHSPRFVDGHWLVCNSRQDEIVAIDPRRPAVHLRRVKVGGYARGLAFDEGFIYVGVSAMRHVDDVRWDSASLVILDRESWRLIDRISVPCPEIYDLRVVPEESVAMLRAARMRTEDEDLHGLSTAPRPPGSTIGSPGVPAGLSIRFHPPKRVRAGEVFYLPARIEHNGSAPIAPSTGGALNLSYRWSALDGGSPVSVGREEPLRTPFPLTLDPASHADVDVVVRAPALSGRYCFRVVLVEEGVRWVDDSEPHAFAEVALEVGDPVFG